MTDAKDQLDAAVSDALNDIACERCLGMGWIRIRRDVRGADGLYSDASEYPNCPRCEGTGIEPKDAPSLADRG